MKLAITSGGLDIRVVVGEVEEGLETFIAVALEHDLASVGLLEVLGCFHEPFARAAENEAMTSELLFAIYAAYDGEIRELRVLVPHGVDIWLGIASLVDASETSRALYWKEAFGKG
jgi:hypothetical protein